MRTTTAHTDDRDLHTDDRDLLKCEDDSSEVADSLLSRHINGGTSEDEQRIRAKYSDYLLTSQKCLFAALSIGLDLDISPSSTQNIAESDNKFGGIQQDGLRTELTSKYLG